MNGTRPGVVLFAVLLSLAVAGVGVGFLAASTDVASAGHGDADADYTVEPQDPGDREPGASNAQYGQIVVAQAGVDFETLESLEAVYEEGSWTSCGQGDADEFGIDRGNTHDGYETDESLEENVKQFSAGEDSFYVEFNGEDDIGASTHLDDGDAIVSLATCIQNPDEPGWYQISGSSSGVTEDGEEMTISGESHYFWICECSSEEEAREELGPPPSEEGDGGEGDGEDGAGDAGEETATPEEDDGSSEDDADGDSSDGGDSGASSDGDDSTDADDDGSDEGDESTDADEGTDDGASDDGASDDGNSGQDEAVEAEADSNGSDDWDDERVETPTPGDGPGFGPGIAIVALLGSALLLRRRG